MKFKKSTKHMEMEVIAEFSIALANLAIFKVIFNPLFNPVTKSTYDCKLPSATASLSCHDANVTCLITCNRCYLQYAGETVRKRNERVN